MKGAGNLACWLAGDPPLGPDCILLHLFLLCSDRWAMHVTSHSKLDERIQNAWKKTYGSWRCSSFLTVALDILAAERWPVASMKVDCSSFHWVNFHDHTQSQGFVTGLFTTKIVLPLRYRLQQIQHTSLKASSELAFPTLKIKRAFILVPIKAFSNMPQCVTKDSFINQANRGVLQPLDRATLPWIRNYRIRLFVYTFKERLCPSFPMVCGSTLVSGNHFADHSQ